MVIKTGKKTKTVCFLSIYIRDLNLAPIRFVQFACPAIFPAIPTLFFYNLYMYETIIVKKDEISDSFLAKTTCVIGKVIKKYM